MNTNFQQKIRPSVPHDKICWLGSSKRCLHVVKLSIYPLSVSLAPIPLPFSRHSRAIGLICDGAQIMPIYMPYAT